MRARLTSKGNVKVTMTRSEAETFRFIAEHVGGNPVKSRRGHVDSLADALDALEVPLIEDCLDHYYEWAAKNAIYFANGES